MYKGLAVTLKIDGVIYGHARNNRLGRRRIIWTPTLKIQQNNSTVVDSSMINNIQ